MRCNRDDSRGQVDVVWEVVVSFECQIVQADY